MQYKSVLIFFLYQQIAYKKDAVWITQRLLHEGSLQQRTHIFSAQSIPQQLRNELNSSAGFEWYDW